MTESIGWPQLVALMAFGPDGRADETVRGTIRHRDVETVPDDVEPAVTVEHPVLGRMSVEESTVQVARRGDRSRTTRPDGRVLSIETPDALWSVGGDGTAVVHDRGRGSWGRARDLSRRLPLSRWEGTDFTRLTGPIEATTFLGRPAWAFELAPPSHKPYPLQLVVDARSGLVLRQANRDFGSVVEWTEFEYGVPLPDALFVWDGPSRPAPTEVERRAEHEADLAARCDWLTARGVDAIPLDVEQEVVLHRWDDGTGEFHASVSVRTQASLLRRPHTEEAWDEADQLGWGHVHRWSDARWDWALGTTSALDEAALATLRTRLATTT